jgi:hypothetical protein
LKISEFLSTLPSSTIAGDNIVIPESFFRKMFSFAGLKENDTFYHLGIGDNYSSLLIATQEFHAKRAVGIDIDSNCIDLIKSKIASTDGNIILKEEDVSKSSLSEATVVFSWFTNEKINEILVSKFKSELSDGSKIISIWSPPDLFIPNAVDFPLILCQKPFVNGNSITEQLKAIYGNDCIDFTAAWYMSEKYIQSFDIVESHHLRFLNILQSVIVWLNAKELGIACEKEIPPPIKSYVGILKYFFNIDLSEFLVD